jgi:hypothetical protein
MGKISRPIWSDNSSPFFLIPLLFFYIPIDPLFPHVCSNPNTDDGYLKTSKFINKKIIPGVGLGCTGLELLDPPLLLELINIQTFKNGGTFLLTMIRKSNNIKKEAFQFHHLESNKVHVNPSYL